MEDEIIEFMFLNQNLQVESIILSLITCPFGSLCGEMISRPLCQKKKEATFAVWPLVSF